MNGSDKSYGRDVRDVPYCVHIVNRRAVMDERFAQPDQAGVVVWVRTRGRNTLLTGAPGAALFKDPVGVVMGSA